MINTSSTFKVLDGTLFNSVDNAHKLVVEVREDECKYLIINGIFTEHLACLAEALERCPPKELKAKSIVLITDNKSGATNELDMSAMGTFVRIQKTFGSNIIIPCKDYYIQLRCLNNKIICNRQNGELGMPKELHDKINTLKPKENGLEPALSTTYRDIHHPNIRPIGAGQNTIKANSQGSKLPSDFVRSINSSAIDLCSKLCERRSVSHKNFVFFTPNLLAAFSMLLAGAPEGAKNALENFLGVKDVAGDYHASFGKWINNLSERSVAQANDLAKTAKTANKFFFKQAQAVMTLEGVKIPTDTETRLGNYRPVQISFHDNEEAKKLTNMWVEMQTEGKITNLVETLPDETVLMLVTAALYQGSWKYPFSMEKNSTETFYNSDGTKVKFTMMNQGLDDLRLYSDWKKKATICELPFHGDTSLLVVRCGGSWDRNGAEAAASLSKFMTRENLLDMLEHFDERATPASALRIGIPKIDVKDKTDLFEELASDPMVQSIVGANWTGSLLDYHKPTSTKQLVSEVKFQMDEAGAQIAAASYSPTGAESCDPEFKVNVPFGVILFDNQTKTILGLGQFLKLEGPVAEKNSMWE